MANAFAREYSFNAAGQEYSVFTSEGWSKITIVDRGNGVGSFSLNRRKRTPFGSYDDAFKMTQNTVMEVILGHGDQLYVQGQSADLIEVVASPLPFGNIFGTPDFSAKAETREVPYGDGQTKGIRINPDEFCEVSLNEVGTAFNGMLIGINESTLFIDNNLHFGSSFTYRFKLNRGDALYVAGKDGPAAISMVFSPLPTLGGVIKEFAC